MMKLLRLTVLTICALALTSPVLAQEREPDREAAMERLERARDQLDAALRQLREDDTRDARMELERAIRELREAERGLERGRRGVYSYRLQGPEGRFELFGPEGRPGVVVFDADRPRIGVIVETDSEDGEGAVLAAVTPGGPAAEAGLVAGDVIVSVNGRSVSGDGASDAFVAIVREAEEGDSLRVVYRRDGETESAVVVPRRLDELNTWAYSLEDLSGRLEGLGERMARIQPRAWTMPEMEWHEDSGSVVVAPRIRSGDFATAIVSRLRGGPFMNLELVAVNPDLESYFGTDAGVLVVKVSEDSELPLRGGDVILRIGAREPRNPAHAMRILMSYEEGETISMEIMRDKRRQTVSMEVPEEEDR